MGGPEGAGVEGWSTVMATSKPTDQSPEGDPPTPDEDPVKTRFREALERKNARHHASAAAGESGDSKVASAHGPASHQKQFRRKSGG
jgi:hypothetical protein